MGQGMLKTILPLAQPAPAMVARKLGWSRHSMWPFSSDVLLVGWTEP